MGDNVLDKSILKRFVKEFSQATAKPKATEMSFLATIVEDEDGNLGARIDGAPEGQITPVACTTGINKNDRVTVTIRDHKAYVGGNATNPSSNVSYVNNVQAETSNNLTRIYELLNAKTSSEEFERSVSELREAITANYEELSGLISAKQSDPKLDTIQELLNHISIYKYNDYVGLILRAGAYSIVVDDYGIRFMYYDAEINRFDISQTTSNDFVISVGKQLVQGNFAEIPRSDGSSMLVKVG